jgi:hypothetical protein
MVCQKGLTAINHAPDSARMSEDLKESQPVKYCFIHQVHGSPSLSKNNVEHLGVKTQYPIAMPEVTAKRLIVHSLIIF